MDISKLKGLIETRYSSSKSLMELYKHYLSHHKYDVAEDLLVYSLVYNFDSSIKFLEADINNLINKEVSINVHFLYLAIYQYVTNDINLIKKFEDNIDAKDKKIKFYTYDKNIKKENKINKIIEKVNKLSDHNKKESEKYKVENIKKQLEEVYKNL